MMNRTIVVATPPEFKNWFDAASQHVQEFDVVNLDAVQDFECELNSIVCHGREFLLISSIPIVGLKPPFIALCSTAKRRSLKSRMRAYVAFESEFVFVADSHNPDRGVIAQPFGQAFFVVVESILNAATFGDAYLASQFACECYCNYGADREIQKWLYWDMLNMKVVSPGERFADLVIWRIQTLSQADSLFVYRTLLNGGKHENGVCHSSGE